MTPANNPKVRKTSPPLRPTTNSDGDWIVDGEIVFSNKKMKQLEQERLQEFRRKSFSAPKGKLISSEEIINRIKWDPTYPYEQFVMGYLDRFNGMMEMPVENYLDAEDVDRVPLHRVYYFKINGHKVWERDTKLDLISSGEAQKHVITEEINESSSKIDDAELSSSIIRQKKDSLDTSEKPPTESSINVFSSKRNRSYHKEYVPSDTLESCMHEVNSRENALKEPTHISQRGAYYHIPSRYMEMILSKWKVCVENDEEFFMEEARTTVFRLYIDIDFKTTDGQKVDMVSKGYIPVIQKFTEKFMKKYVPSKVPLSRTVIVTECHGKWSDSVTQDANFKSGYRLYYPSIFVDEHILSKYLQKLSKEFAEKVQVYHVNQPSDWKWENVIDIEQCHHKRGRMFGTCKWRRGNVLGRKYQFTGAFDGEGNVNEDLSAFLQENTSTLVHMTSLRFEKKIQFSRQAIIKTVHISSEGYKVEEVPICNLRQNITVEGCL